MMNYRNTESKGATESIFAEPDVGSDVTAKLSVNEDADIK